ncbi:YlxR family protein [Trebonia kvetii]|jgi:hypothetical protein|uniref:YlxR family protein n=1 Tax=Trebonia kvetii TaxID=2480626 RepID=A0A6P2C4A1_9ACTN|nr:YlxR family protein [Trebonia kvetii]TVZ06239.1 YlxR family protein [Trebonia kvetii]
MIARAKLPEPGNQPLRSCVGCKERAVKSSLLRLVAVRDGIVPDPQARQPGRGAYLHPSLACFELAQRRRAFSRALRVSGSLSAAPLASYLSERNGEGPGSTLDMTGNLYGKQVEKL